MTPDDLVRSASTAPVPTVAAPQAPDADSADSARMLSDIFGSFWIDGTEFAIPAQSLQEVVNAPDAISTLPLAPDYLLGLFSLRGSIIPIVDLRSYLGFPSYDGAEMRKVAIIAAGPLRVGLLFDSTGELLNARDAARTDFRKAELERNEVVIEGVLRFENGDRIVQILDPHEIFQLKHVPQSPSEQDGASARASLGARVNCISFQLGHTCFGLDLRHIQEVTEMMEIDRSLMSHGCILGTANLRGTILPIVDFRGYVSGEVSHNLDLSKLSNRKIIVMNTQGGPIGFLVFSIDSILPYFEGDVLPFAKIALPRNDMVQGCILDDASSLVLMIDPEKLLSHDDFIKTATACQQIYQDSETSETEEKKLSLAARRTYILVKIGTPIALDMDSVCEVINPPEELLAPPYRLPFVEGIINLRGELISLINPRKLYNLPEHDGEDDKVLIFLHDGTKYAILVDSVDEIAMATDEQILDTPKIKKDEVSEVISKDMEGCLKLPGRSEDAGMVMILNVGALVKLCLSRVGNEIRLGA